MSTIFFFGRCNPPTKAHKQILERFKNEDLRIYLSHTHDIVQNPLTWSQKNILFEMMGLPVQDSRARNPFEALMEVHASGVDSVMVLLGKDRMEELSERIMKYNGSLYNFKQLSFGSTGERDDGISSSLLREQLDENGYSDLLPPEIAEQTIDFYFQNMVNEDSYSSDFTMVKTTDAYGHPTWRKQKRMLTIKKKVNKEQNGETRS